MHSLSLSFSLSRRYPIGLAVNHKNHVIVADYGTFSHLCASSYYHKNIMAVIIIIITAMLCDICAVHASSANHSADTFSLSQVFVVTCANASRVNRFHMCSLVRMDDRKSSNTGIFPRVSAQNAAECVRINQHFTLPSLLRRFWPSVALPVCAAHAQSFHTSRSLLPSWAKVMLSEYLK